MMNEVIKCLACGNRFPNNPERHKHRQKFCPYCRTPYKKSVFSLKTSVSLKAVKKVLQNAFNFFPRIGFPKLKPVYYECPRCHFVVASNEDLKVRKVPDKTEETADGEMKVLTYRDIPICRQCGTYLTRRRGEP